MHVLSCACFPYWHEKTFYHSKLYHRMAKSEIHASMFAPVCSMSVCWVFTFRNCLLNPIIFQRFHNILLSINYPIIILKRILFINLRFQRYSVFKPIVKFSRSFTTSIEAFKSFCQLAFSLLPSSSHSLM